MADLDNSLSVVGLAVEYDQIAIRGNHQLLVIVNHRPLHAIAKPILQVNAVQQRTFLSVMTHFACFADDGEEAVGYLHVHEVHEIDASGCLFRAHFVPHG